MTASPALSSAPSSVVPSVVMIVLPISGVQVRVLADADDLRRIPRQHDVAAVVVADHLRLDVLARVLGRGIDVRVERDGRRAGHVARHRGEDEAVLVLHRVLEAHRQEFVAEHLAEHELSRRTRIGRGLLVRLRVDADVAEEAVEQSVGRERHETSPRRTQSTPRKATLLIYSSPYSAPSAFSVVRSVLLLPIHADLRAQRRERALFAPRLSRETDLSRPCRISR